MPVHTTRKVHFFSFYLVVIYNHNMPQPPVTRIGIAYHVQQIEELSRDIDYLPGHQKEIARRSRDELIETLIQMKGLGGWRTNVRLTIMDNDRTFYHENIKFCHPDGSVASDSDLRVLDHVIVMPVRATHCIDAISEHPALVKYDTADVSWVPITTADTNYLILKFSTGRVYTISDAYSIRAFSPGVWS
jgi:hypothetical protein